MSEKKKLPQTVVDEATAAVAKEMEALSATPPDDAALPETFKDPSAMTTVVEGALGKKVKALAYGPFGQMLHEGAQDFLRENEPELWALLQRDKFGS